MRSGGCQGGERRGDGDEETQVEGKRKGGEQKNVGIRGEQAPTPSEPVW